MNPFHYGTVVKKPFFFDRKEELKRIIATLSGGNNLVLYAPRRYGKTSLVMQAIEALENKGFTCIYFDFMTVYSRESFMEVFSKAFLATQSNVKQALAVFSKFVKGIKPTISVDGDGKPEFSITFTESTVTDKTLEFVIDLPHRLATQQKRYIIIMDEFQDITKLNGENFEGLLRSRIQHHQYVNYLFLGSRTHLLSDMFNNKNRPFYNSATSMNLGPLPRVETIAFLIERFAGSGITIDERIALALIKKAEEIPYYIQFLASEIWQTAVNSGKTVNEETVAACANNILDLKNDYYFELFDRHSAYRKKLLKALAVCGQNVFSNDYARRFRLSATSTTQKAIHNLINSGVIEKHGNGYRFSDPFFRQFVLRLMA